jgi:hypothetical protein
MTSVPLGRPKRPLRGIQRAPTCSTSPASLARPFGHFADTGPVQPALSGWSATRPPSTSTGSSRRTDSLRGPAGSLAAQLRLSCIHATSPLALPRSIAAQSTGVRGRRDNSPIPSGITAIQLGPPKCRRPVARPAPYAIVNRIGGRSLTTTPLGRLRTSPSPATRRH